MIHPREVARLLTVREWLALCDQVDGTFGVGRKFDVIRIDREDDALEVTVSVEGIDILARLTMGKQKKAA